MTNTTYDEQLSPLDLSMPRTYIRAALVFEQVSSTPNIIQQLQNGLERLSKQNPWLSGRVYSKPTTQDADSSLEIRWNANSSPTLVDKGTVAVSYEYASSHGMPIESISPDIWPASGMIDDTLYVTGVPVFVASIFRFSDQGGVGLCVCIHHNFVDGTGFLEILQLWAQNVTNPGGFTLSRLLPQGRRSERISEALSFDLQETRLITSETLFKLHPEYSKIPPSVPEKQFPCTSKLFTVSMHWIHILKELLRKYTLKPPTTNTVICALIWTTVTRVRVQCNPSFGGEMSRLVTAVNGRQRIGENLSTPNSPYFGNAVFYSLSKFSAGVLAASDETPVRSLALICDHIAESQSPSVINSRHIAEVYHLIDRMEDCRSSLFPGWDLFGSRDLTITSWAELGLYDVDFGDGIGRPKFVRLPYMEADGVALILPRQRNISQDVLEVLVMLRRDHMDALESDPMWQTLLSIGR